MNGLFRKDLSEIDNPRIVKLVGKTLHYNLEIEHVPGKDNKGADALSRMGCTDTEAPEVTNNFSNTREVKINIARIRKNGTMKNIPLDLLVIARKPNQAQNTKHS